MTQLPSITGRLLVVGAAILGLGAVLLAVLTVSVRKTLPVVATLGGADAVTRPVAAIDLGLALTVLLAGGAVVLGAARLSRTEPARRILSAAGWSQGAGILVVLVARANGIAEVAALVPLYAIAATSVLLQLIDPGPPTPTWRRPGAWAAVVGIVPWGVIAFAQVGAIVVGDPPSVGIRIATLLGLAVAATGWWTAWRRPAAPGVVAMAAALFATAYLLLASY